MSSLDNFISYCRNKYASFSLEFSEFYSLQKFPLFCILVLFVVINLKFLITGNYLLMGKFTVMLFLPILAPIIMIYLAFTTKFYLNLLGAPFAFIFLTIGYLILYTVVLLFIFGLSVAVNWILKKYNLSPPDEYYLKYDTTTDGKNKWRLVRSKPSWENDEEEEFRYVGTKVYFGDIISKGVCIGIVIFLSIVIMFIPSHYFDSLILF